MRLELHCHSHHSRGKKIPVEGLDSPAELVRAAKRLGLGGLALTDHNSDRGWREAAAEARKLGVLFIPAIEISSLQGHVIGLGMNGPVKPGLSAEETLEKIREQGAVSVAAHPFDIRGEGTGRLAARADAIEAFNSINLDRFSNSAAKRFALKKGMPMVAGSDSHTKEMLGSCVNFIDAHDLDSALRGIKAGKARFSTGYPGMGKLLPWTRKRMLLSHREICSYIDSNYSQPRKWASQRLLHIFTSSRRERPWRMLGEIGLAGAGAYGLARVLSRA
jgi:predicted metal-dependent phosphoesterase TrpH